jgi:hypothetical protein
VTGPREARFAQVTRVGRIVAPLRQFVATQNASAIVLVAATVAALVWANSPWSSSYNSLWNTKLAVRLGSNELSLDLRQWVNDGLMAFFFFVVGLEIRREFDMGELRERRRIATPVLAALGGMLVPALIYLAFNAGTPTTHGWAIPMATDTAFALGTLALVGGPSAPSVRPFLLTLVIVDDIAALTVVALVYTKSVSVTALAIAAALFALVLVMRPAGVRHGVRIFSLGSEFGSRCSLPACTQRSPEQRWAWSRPRTRQHVKISSEPVRGGACSARSRHRRTHARRAGTWPSSFRPTSGCSICSTRGRVSSSFRCSHWPTWASI